MNDSYNLPTNARYERWFFGGQSNDDWVEWIKPKGIMMVSILAIGAGAGGGGGFSGATGTNRNAGGGGGSGAMARLVIPACMLPDVLYVQCGMGGTGGGPGATGASGNKSYVLAGTTSVSNSANVVLVTGSAEAGGGRPGLSTAGGAAGPAETIAVAGASAPFATCGIHTIIAGAPGAAGGSGAQGNSSTAFSTIPLCGGAGGGGVAASNSNQLGGNVTSAISVFVIGTISGGAAATKGADGRWFKKLF
jgi:hypothetical protein